MSIVIKTEDEIIKMRAAGKLAAQVLEMITPHVKAGITTEQLDILCANFTKEHGAISAPLNYHGFPKSICTSINEVICHGIPSDRALIDGDIINIDITVIKDGYHGDTSKMFCIGEVSEANKRLCNLSQEALYAAIKMLKPGVKVSDIGENIEKTVNDRNKLNRKSCLREKYSIVSDFCGHGIGAGFHEEPQVMHYKDRYHQDKRILKAGMCFTIEPMINAGKKQCVVDKQDGWTARTIDGKNSAQWEHTVLITATGVEVLTLRDDEKLSRFY